MCLRPRFTTPTLWRRLSEDNPPCRPGALQSNAPLFSPYPKTLNLYRQLLDEGVCPEQARIVLPQSMMTEWYWSGSLDAFADMCNLRCADDTQAETSIVADAIDEEMEQLFPVAWEALRNE